MPSLQLFLFRPRVEDALPRRADRASDFDGGRRNGFSGHGSSDDEWFSRYVARRSSSDSQNRRYFAIHASASRIGAALSVARRTRPSFSTCLLYTSPSPRDRQKSRMPSSA